MVLQAVLLLALFGNVGVALWLSVSAGGRGPANDGDEGHG
jgi:hypothetical protein